MKFAIPQSLKRYAWITIRLIVPLIVTILFFRFNQDISALASSENPNEGYYHPAWNLLMLVLLWAAFLLPHRITQALPAKVLSYLFLAAVPAAHLSLVELLIPRTREIFPGMLQLNVILYYLAFLFLLFLFRRHSELCVLVSTVVAWLFGTVNCVAWQYRSLPVLPWDLYSTRTALSVASDYRFELTHTFLMAQLAFLCIIVIGFRLRLPHHIPFRVLHWSLAGVIGVGLAMFVLFLQTDTVFSKYGGYRYLFTPTVYYERNGAAVSFLSCLHYLNVDKPDGYDSDRLAEQAAAYAAQAKQEKDAALAQAEQAERKTDVLPNIIVIMNEAFSDLRALCDYETNIPVTPFIDSLTENTVKGNLHVSIKGGNTANSEFEFLTGGSMAFLPMGSIPYQQHLHNTTPNLASHLKSLGYITHAAHPYGATGWNRNTVYPMFSFDTSAFLGDFYPLYSSDLLRGYVSDACLFDHIIEQYESKEAGTPLFTFAVTMQNHGSYDKEYSNFKPNITVNGIETYARISAYLSLIRVTDDAFASFVEYFAAVDEKTVIVMFGDHQPNDNVVSTLMKNGGVDSSVSALDAANRYITPYVLWANYDIDEEDIAAQFSTEDISVSYLSTMLTYAAELPLTGYQSFLMQMQRELPVVTAKTILDGVSDTLYCVDDLHTLEQTHPLLSAWRMFAYNHIFDTKNNPAGFFD